MKKIILYSLIFVSCCVGCTDNFLTVTPNGELDPSKLNATLLQQMRNSVYTTIPGSESIVFDDSYADNSFARNSWDSHGLRIQTNTISSDCSFGYGNWATYGDKDNVYASARKIADFLALLKTVSDEGKISKENAALYGAEAKVMRAWLYANLTLFYGKIALITEKVNVFTEPVIRKPEAEVRTWILKEFDDAIANLPPVNERGRFNKWQALALKARMAYFFGKYAEAEAAANTIITQGPFSLNQVSYASLDETEKKDGEFFWKLVNPAKLDNISKEDFIRCVFSYRNTFNTDGSSELIMVKEYEPSEDYGDYVRITLLTPSNLTDKEGWNTASPMRDVADSYAFLDNTYTLPNQATRASNFNALHDYVINKMKGSDGDANKTADNLDFSTVVNNLVSDGSLFSFGYMKEFMNRDPRFYASLVFPFSATNTFIDNIYWDYTTLENLGQTGYAWRKLGGAKNPVSIWGGSYYASGDDFPIIRLAEMLLVFAESHTQTIGYDGAVTAALNKLRSRAGMVNVPAGLSKNEALELIRKERRVELAGEGLRYYDIRLYEDNTRNGGYKGTQAASVVMSGDVFDPYGNKVVTKVWDPRLMLLPIPAAASDVNPELLKDQNPGY